MGTTAPNTVLWALLPHLFTVLVAQRDERMAADVHWGLGLESSILCEDSLRLFIQMLHFRHNPLEKEVLGKVWSLEALEGTAAPECPGSWPEVSQRDAKAPTGKLDLGPKLPKRQWGGNPGHSQGPGREGTLGCPVASL